MKFTKNTIMLDIAKRMGDNELKLYKYRGWSAFQNTLAILCADRTAWERQEISPLLKTVVIDMVFEDATFPFALPADAIAFTDVWIDPAVANAWGGMIKRIDEADAQRASTGEIAFMPAGNAANGGGEIFWYNIGDEFRFILSRDMYKKPNTETGTVAISGALSLEYVADPSTLDFETTVNNGDVSPYTADIFNAIPPSVSGLPDLVDWFGFSSRILYRCINDSIAMIRVDDEVAQPKEKAIDIEDTSGMGVV